MSLKVSVHENVRQNKNYFQMKIRCTEVSLQLFLINAQMLTITISINKIYFK